MIASSSSSSSSSSSWFSSSASLVNLFPFRHQQEGEKNFPENKTQTDVQQERWTTHLGGKEHQTNWPDGRKNLLSGQSSWKKVEKKKNSLIQTKIPKFTSREEQERYLHVVCGLFANRHICCCFLHLLLVILQPTPTFSPILLSRIKASFRVNKKTNLCVFCAGKMSTQNMAAHQQGILPFSLLLLLAALNHHPGINHGEFHAQTAHPWAQMTRMMRRRISSRRASVGGFPKQPGKETLNPIYNRLLGCCCLAAPSSCSEREIDRGER